MNKVEQQNWRTLQIAVADIKKYLSPSSIEQTKTDSYFDLIVTLADQEIAFGVKIVRSGYIKTNSYAEYLQRLEQHASDLQLPIVLMSINEAQEEVRIGLQFSWQYRRPVVISSVTLRSSSIERWNYIIDVIRATASEIYKVGVLHLDNCYIKKTIKLEVPNQAGELHLAELVYLRKLSTEYKMNSPQERSPEDQFNLMLNGIPQSEYPSDVLDEAIFKAVYAKYQIQPTYNEMMILTTELSEVLRYREYCRGHVIVSLVPEIDDMYEVVSKLLGQFSIFNVEIDLFSQSNKDLLFFNELSFEHQDPINGWMENVMEYRKKMATYKRLSELF